jgi:hypothetical protein
MRIFKFRATEDIPAARVAACGNRPRPLSPNTFVITILSSPAAESKKERLMKSKVTSMLALLAILLVATRSWADITQSTFNFSATTSVPLSGLGQSFTADASVANLLSAMFVVTSNASGMSVTARLYDGAGYGGTLLDTDIVNLPNVLPTQSPIFFDFTGNSLTNGGVYSIRLTPTGLLSLQAADTDPYSGGAMLDGSGAAIPGFDFRFTIHGEAQVPEPSSLALIGCAAAFVCGRRRRN